MNLATRRTPKKNMIYTIAFDPPQSEGYRFLGKMLVSSLLRTFFDGDIVVFRNSVAPLFMVERKGLEEVYIETEQLTGRVGMEEAWCWKYRVAELIENPEQYDKILFLDCDSLALRNVDHLLEGDWDIRYQPEREKTMDGRSFQAFLTEEEMAVAALRDGANSGTLAVRGSCFHAVMEKWREIDEGPVVRESGFRDQASWNALLLRHTEWKGDATAGPDAGSSMRGVALASGGEAQAAPPPLLWRAEAFPVGEVQFPGYLDPHYSSYTKAVLTHNIMPDTLEKIEFTFGLYMRTFFCDPTGLFFSMLEM